MLVSLSGDPAKSVVGNDAAGRFRSQIIEWLARSHSMHVMVVQLLQPDFKWECSGVGAGRGRPLFVYISLGHFLRQ